MSEPNSPSTEPPGPPIIARPLAFRILRTGAWPWLGIGLFCLLLFVLIFWSTLALYYANTRPVSGPRHLIAGLFVVAAIVLAIFIRPRRRGLGLLAMVLICVFTWYMLLKPSNTRDWEADTSRPPNITINGDQFTVHNVRNFDYRSETDYTPLWEDRTYDLSTLRTADFILVYWGSEAIAHVMVSFGFADGRHLCASIETRKEKGETYSSVQGFFRQYEIIFIFADERDLIRLRTNYRNEQVYLYRSTATPAQAKNLLLTYARHANALHDTPEFYNALTTNCATSVVDMPEEDSDSKIQGVSWEILLSGYAARQAYRNHKIDTSLPFEELQHRSLINDAARAAGKSDDFSNIIRAGLPGYAAQAVSQ